jgi:ATP-dependent DNA helicase PIF1
MWNNTVVRKAFTQAEFQNLVQGKLVNGSVGKVTDFRALDQALKDRIKVPGIEDQQGSQDPRAEGLKTSSTLWPLVRFTDGQEILCVSADFTVNNPDGDVEARRSQVNTRNI